MFYALVLLTSVGAQEMGSYDDYFKCEQEAEIWRRQHVAAGCIQKKDPREVFNEFMEMLNESETQLD